MTDQLPNEINGLPAVPLADSRFYTGKHAYHRLEDCAGQNSGHDDRISLIRALRRDLTPCPKCNPPDRPTEYAICKDCGWRSPVDECERDRGYRGACPACGSPKTTSEFER